MNAITGHRNGTLTLRCITPSGDDLTQPISIDLNGTMAVAALKSVIGDRANGTMAAASFARAVFNAMCDYEGQHDLRTRVILKHLRALDSLALAAVTRDIPATITWS